MIMDILIDQAMVDIEEVTGNKNNKISLVKLCLIP